MAPGWDGSPWDMALMLLQPHKSRTAASGLLGALQLPLLLEAGAFPPLAFPLCTATILLCRHI